MARFHFHTEDGHRVTDEDGSELLDLATASRQAVTLLGETLKEDPGVLLATGAFTITVTDDERMVLFKVEACVHGSPATLNRPGPLGSKG